MNSITISFEELSALSGLPYLQQLLYLRGVRPYVDYQTNLVGIKRGVSYQSFSEALYIEPHQGIKGGSPSKDQLRRALRGLERVGLLEIQSLERKLILKCLLVKENYSVQKKLAINPHHEEAITKQEENQGNTRDKAIDSQNLAPVKNTKPTTPLIQDNNYIFLLQQFEKFWDNYPEQKSKEKAWQIFQTLKPNAELLMQIHSALQAQIHLYQLQKSRGQWVAAWKFPANWLAQHCWKDEIQFDAPQEKKNAVHETNSKNQPATDSFWESCKSGLEEESSHDNVIEFSNWRGKSQAY